VHAPSFIAEPLESTIAPAEFGCNPFGPSVGGNQACVCSDSGWSFVAAILSVGLTGYMCAVWYLAN
jgi:hypothetical protein